MNESTVISLIALAVNVIVTASSLIWLAYRAGVQKATYDLKDAALDRKQNELAKAIDDVIQEAKELRKRTETIPILENRTKGISEFPAALEALNGRLRSLEDWRGSRQFPRVPRPSRPDPGESGGF